MKELFEEAEPVGVSDSTEEKIVELKYTKRICTYCGGTDRVTIWGNGICKCQNCIVRVK
jgi:hypothetical protein